MCAWHWLVWVTLTTCAYLLLQLSRVLAEQSAASPLCQLVLPFQVTLIGLARNKARLHVCTETRGVRGRGGDPAALHSCLAEQIWTPGYCPWISRVNAEPISHKLWWASLTCLIASCVGSPDRVAQIIIRLFHVYIRGPAASSLMPVLLLFISGGEKSSVVKSMYSYFLIWHFYNNNVFLLKLKNEFCFHSSLNKLQVV